MSLTSALGILGGAVFLVGCGGAWHKRSPTAADHYEELCATLAQVADDHKVGRESLSLWHREVVFSLRRGDASYRIYVRENNDNIPLASGGVVGGSSNDILYFEEGQIPGVASSLRAYPPSYLLLRSHPPSVATAEFTRDPWGYQTFDSSFSFDAKAYSEVKFREFLSRVDPEALSDLDFQAFEAFPDSLWSQGSVDPEFAQRVQRLRRLTGGHSGVLIREDDTSPEIVRRTLGNLNTVRRMVEAAAGTPEAAPPRPARLSETPRPKENLHAFYSVEQFLNDRFPDEQNRWKELAALYVVPKDWLNRTFPPSSMQPLVLDDPRLHFMMSFHENDPQEAWDRIGPEGLVYRSRTPPRAQSGYWLIELRAPPSLEYSIYVADGVQAIRRTGAGAADLLAELDKAMKAHATSRYSHYLQDVKHDYLFSGRRLPRDENVAKPVVQRLHVEKYDVPADYRRTNLVAFNALTREVLREVRRDLDSALKPLWPLHRTALDWIRESNPQEGMQPLSHQGPSGSFQISFHPDFDLAQAYPPRGSKSRILYGGSRDLRESALGDLWLAEFDAPDGARYVAYIGSAFASPVYAIVKVQ